MPGKPPSTYDHDEVALFLTAIGLESKVDTFREKGIDGDMLVALEAADFEELGLSGLQGKKIKRSVEFVASLADESGGGADASELAALQKELAELKNENAALRAQLKQYAPAPAPPPAPKPKPAPAPAPPPQPHGIVGAGVARRHDRREDRRDRLLR